MTHPHLALLQRHVEAGHLSRRAFVARAAALGLSAPAIMTALAACGGSSSKATATPASGLLATATSADVTINNNVTPTPVPSVASGSPSAASASPTAPLGKAGGTLTLSRQTDSTLLDPPGNILNEDIWVFDSIYDRLIGLDDKGTGLLPELAEKWDVSDDGLTYTFHIRSGVKFSDGSDLSMDDITWTLNRAKTLKDSPWSFSLAQVKDITASGASTVVITLTQVWAPFLSDVSLFSNNIISKAFATKVGEAELAEQTMGTGPYALKEWKRGESLTLVKNQYYWEPGLPLLDEIVFKVIPDGNNQILQLQGGQIDGIVGQGDIPFNRVADLKKDSNLQVMSFLSTFVNFIVLNCRKAPLNDVKLRQALNYATDKQALIDTVLFGNGVISNSFMPNGALYWNADQKPYPYDLDQANTLLKASNSPNGVKFELQVRSGNQVQLQLATALKDMWAKINVNIDISQLDQGVFNDNYFKANFDAQPSGWTNDIIDPDEVVSLAILPDSQGSWETGWVNQQAFDLANQGRATRDDAQRRQIYYQIQQIHHDDAPLVFLYVIPYIDALNKKVQNFFQHPMGQYVFTRTSLA